MKTNSTIKFCGLIALALLACASTSAEAKVKAAKTAQLPPATNQQSAAVVNAAGAPWIENYVEGVPDAPLEITVYFSPTNYRSAEVFGSNRAWLKENYVDKGLVRLKYQEMYKSFDSKKMFAILHCMPKTEYIPTLSGLFTLMNKDPNRAEGKKHNPSSHQCTSPECRTYINHLLAQLAPKDATKNACLASKDLHNWRYAQQIVAKHYMGIRATPVYILGNSSYRLDNRSSTEAFRVLIEAYLHNMQPATAPAIGAEKEEQQHP